MSQYEPWQEAAARGIWKENNGWPLEYGRGREADQSVSKGAVIRDGPRSSTVLLVYVSGLNFWFFWTDSNKDKDTKQNETKQDENKMK